MEEDEIKDQFDQLPSDDQKDIGFGIKKRSEDKLVYKLIIAGAIRQCMATRGSMSFMYSVESLISVIKFDIKGYHFIPKIEELKKRLDREEKQKIEKYKEEMGLNFGGNVEQVIIRLDIRAWYWPTLFQGIIQLLAEHNLLMETEKYVPVGDIEWLDEHKTI